MCELRLHCVHCHRKHCKDIFTNTEFLRGQREMLLLLMMLWWRKKNVRNIFRWHLNRAMCLVSVLLLFVFWYFMVSTHHKRRKNVRARKRKKCRMHAWHINRQSNRLCQYMWSDILCAGQAVWWSSYVRSRVRSRPVWPIYVHIHFSFFFLLWYRPNSFGAIFLFSVTLHMSSPCWSVCRSFAHWRVFFFFFSLSCYGMVLMLLFGCMFPFLS